MTGYVVVTFASRTRPPSRCMGLAWSKDYGGTLDAKARIGKVRGGEDVATPWASGRQTL